MAITLPQDQGTVQLKGQPNFRLSGAKGAQISPKFLGTLGQGLAAKSKAERDALLKKKKEQSDYIIKKHSNDNTGLEVRAKAKVNLATGENAFSTLDTESKQLKKDLEKSLENIPEELQGRARGSISDTMRSFNTSSIPHALGEARKLKTKEYELDTSNKIHKSVEVSSDEDMFEEGLGKVAQSAEENAILKYGDTSTALIENHKSLAVSTTILTAVNQAAKLGQSKVSKNLVEKFGHLLRKKDIVAANQSIEKAERKNEDSLALILQKAASDEHPDSLVDQEKHIFANAPNGRVYQTSLSIAQTNHIIAGKDKKLKEDTALESAYNAADESLKNNTKIDEDLLGKVAGKDRGKILKYIQDRGNVPTDEEAFLQASKQYRNDPEEFKNRNFRAESNKFSKADLRALESKRDGLINAERSKEARMAATTDKAVDDILKKYEEEFSLSKKDRFRLSQVSRDIYSQLKDLDLDPLEIRRRFDKALALSDIIDDGIRSMGDSGSFSTFVFGKNVGQSVLENPVLRIDLSRDENIHPSVVKAIEAARVNKNMPAATEAEMKKHINDYRDDGNDPSKPVKQ